MTWTDATTSNTTSRNASRFIKAQDYADGSGGVDFAPPISTEAFWIISTNDPITLSSTTRNDPI